MPFTVITLKKVPTSLRGDLTKWMQEIATGVYVGNFNSSIREYLWERVKKSADTGEASLSYACRNEIHYNCETFRSDRTIIDCDGIPLVLIPNEQTSPEKIIPPAPKEGFSNASHFHKAHKFSERHNYLRKSTPGYVVLDIETTGLNPAKDSIIEIGAIKFENRQKYEFQSLVQLDEKLPIEIKKLTGITDQLLMDEGHPLSEILDQFTKFIGHLNLVAYNANFDLRFLEKALSDNNMPSLKNKVFDLIRFVKKEKCTLTNYKLSTVLKAYGITDTVPHRALKDAELAFELSLKVNEFHKRIGKTS